jgi:hypothetical protein
MLTKRSVRFLTFMRAECFGARVEFIPWVVDLSAGAFADRLLLTQPLRDAWAECLASFLSVVEIVPDLAVVECTETDSSQAEVAAAWAVWRTRGRNQVMAHIRA